MRFKCHNCGYEYRIEIHASGAGGGSGGSIETKRGPGGQSIKLPCTCNKENRGAAKHSSHCLAANRPAPPAQSLSGDAEHPRNTVTDNSTAASPTQEPWTPEYVDSITAKWISPKDLRAISDAHNAAIAAIQNELTVAYLRVKEWKEACDETYRRWQKKAADAGRACRELAGKLAAERERITTLECAYDMAAQERDQLCEQLDAAVALLERANKWVDHEYNEDAETVGKLRDEINAFVAKINLERKDNAKTEITINR